MSELLKPASSARKVARALDVDEGATLDDVVRSVERLRGRPIRIEVAEDLRGTDACGIWFPGDLEDRIFHAPTTSQTHRRHIVLHELSHMLLGHDEIAIEETQLPAAFPDLPVGRLLLRTSFTTPMEADAEELAFTLQRLVDHDARVLHGFGRAFE